MSGLRVILDVDAIRYPLTGIGRYAYELAKGLKQHPEVASLRFMANGRWLSEPAPAVSSRQTGGMHPSPLSILAGRLAEVPLLLGAYRQLRSLIAWQRLRGYADHIYHSPNYFLPPCPGPAIATIHDLSVIRYPEFHPPERLALFRHEWPKTLARAHHLVTDSETIRQEVIAYCAWPPERVTAIPLGVDPIFHPRPPAELISALDGWGLQPKGYCLCVATIEPRKNIPNLIEAYARLPLALQRRFPLVLVGARGWNSTLIHERIQAAQRTGNVRYLEYVDEQRLPLLFAGAYLFAYPSFYEGFGLPLLEAMASGVPAVTSTCPTLTELARDIALQVDPSDIDALAQALQRGLEDDGWRQQAHLEGIKRAQQYTWARCIDQTLRLYASMWADDRRVDKRSAVHQKT